MSPGISTITDTRTAICVYARSNRALVGKESRDAPFVFGTGAGDETRMEKQPILTKQTVSTRK